MRRLLVNIIGGFWHSPLVNARFGTLVLRQQAGTWLVYSAHFAQMLPLNLYFAEILPNIDRRQWHIAYPQNVIENPEARSKR